MSSPSSYILFQYLTHPYLVERVRWFRVRAARDCYREELEILDEEFHRTHLSFTRMNEIWKVNGEKQIVLRKEDDCTARGYHAFAHHQAAIYSKLASEAWEHWNQAQSLSQHPQMA